MKAKEEKQQGKYSDFKKLSECKYNKLKFAIKQATQSSSAPKTWVVFNRMHETSIFYDYLAIFCELTVSAKKLKLGRKVQLINTNFFFSNFTSLATIVWGNSM